MKYISDVYSSFQLPPPIQKKRREKQLLITKEMSVRNIEYCMKKSSLKSVTQFTFWWWESVVGHDLVDTQKQVRVQRYSKIYTNFLGRIQ